VAHHRARQYAQQLRACHVQLIGRVEARFVIIKHEHLHSMGNSKIIFWLALA